MTRRELLPGTVFMYRPNLPQAPMYVEPEHPDSPYKGLSWKSLPAPSDLDQEVTILWAPGKQPGPVFTKPVGLPSGYEARKALPIFRGVLMYFPDALLAVSAVSKAGNDQHNPGEPLHWAREKSTEQMDTALRHMMDHGLGNTKDTDGTYHLAKAAWRLLAELQLTIEADAKKKAA